jgi:hypothetical protein
MLILKYKYRSYNRKEEIIGESFKDLYYKLIDNFGRVEFEVNRYITEELEEFDYNKYRQMEEEDFEKAMEYFDSMEDYISDEEYRYFIKDLFLGKGYRECDYKIEIYNVYYFDEICNYCNLISSFEEEKKYNEKLLLTGKVKKDFNDRLYTEDYNLYNCIEEELEDY